MYSLAQLKPPRISRGILIAAVGAATAATVFTSVISPGGAPARPTTVNVTSLCDQTATAVQAAYTDPTALTSVLDAAKVPASAQRAAYKLTGAEIANIDAARSNAISSCLTKLNAVTSAWSYLSAKLAEIAVNAVIVALGSTIICAFTGPVACAWGVRFAGFIGGFVGSLFNQYLRGTPFSATSARDAFVAAFVSMLAATGLSAATQRLIKDGVRGTLNGVGSAIQGVLSRISGLGAVTSDADSVMTNIAGQSIFAGVASTGHATIEPVLDVHEGDLVGGPVEIRAAADVANLGPTSNDIHMGSASNETDYEFTIADTTYTDSAGDHGYIIAKSGTNNCFTYAGSGAVSTATCNGSDSKQVWYVVGDELVNAAKGWCLAQSGGAEKAAPCVGEDSSADYNNDYEYYAITKDVGTYMPDTLADWKSNYTIYEN